jgi:hypothetical protein
MAFDPEGRSTIARQFTAGKENPATPLTSPVGTAEMELQWFNRPYGTEAEARCGPFHPAMNRWAIVKRPSGSKALPSGLRTTKSMQPDRTLRRIRICLVIFMLGLVLSGLTAFPLETELKIFASILPDVNRPHPSGFTQWILTVRHAVVATNHAYPFLAYGTDWLAFAHLTIAVAFLGPLRDPVKNVWVVDFGLIACAGVIPLALIAGEIRGIPLGWRLIDCSFGVFGAVPLLIARYMIRHITTTQDKSDGNTTCL